VAVSGDLATALATLDPDERALIVLRHLLGYRSTELARILDVPAPTVRTRLARALARLRMLLDEEAREAS
jgi:RNA polymerase sigma-70 factor, ECF subfamily